MNRIDNAVQWAINRYAFARGQWSKANEPEKNRLLVNLLGGDGYSFDLATSSTDPQKIYEAAITNWVFSDISLIAREFSGASMSVIRREGEQKVAVANHAFEQLLAHPNPEFDLIFLWQYTMWWLNLSGNAYWFLSPEMGNRDTIAEIWPIRADRVVAVPNATQSKFVDYYLYTTNSGTKIKIDRKYLAHFMFPNPFDLYRGLAPLTAALLDVETDRDTAIYQKGSYSSGRGIPASIILLNEDMNDRDFSAASAQIKEDFAQERKLIISRGNDIKVASVGISQKEMDLIVQRRFNKDAVDRVFLGVELSGGEGEGALREKHKLIRDGTIYPYHQLLAGQVSVQIIHPFYGEEYFAEFEDIRAQDRSLNVQERNVYWRVKSIDEARRDLGLGPYQEAEVGKLLVNLATDAAFVGALLGITTTSSIAKGELPDTLDRQKTPVGSLSEADAPKRIMNNTIEGKAVVMPTAAEEDASLSELKRWQKVALKDVRQKKNPGVYEFKSEILTAYDLYTIRGELWEGERTEDGVRSIFDAQKARRTRRGRPSKPIAAVNSYESELRKIYDEWADTFADDLAETKDEDGDIDAIIALALLLLLSQLQDLGRKNIPAGLWMGLGDTAPTPEVLTYLATLVGENDKYLADSFIPDLKAKIGKALADPDVLLAFATSKEAGRDAIRAYLGTMDARIGSYAGTWWRAQNYGAGSSAKADSKPIKAFLDPAASHCEECPLYHDEGGREYKSFDDYLATTSQRVPGMYICRGNCRCWLAPA